MGGIFGYGDRVLARIDQSPRIIEKERSDPVHSKVSTPCERNASDDSDFKMSRRTRNAVKAFFRHVLPLVEHRVDEFLHPWGEVRDHLPGEDLRHVLSDGGVLRAVQR